MWLLISMRWMRSRARGTGLKTPMEEARCMSSRMENPSSPHSFTALADRASIFWTGEAALSPLRQMSLLARMHELAAQNSQFIIATHSPILMSYPGAEILLLKGESITPVALEDTDHYTVTRAFMTNREKMLRELLGDEPDPL